MREWIAMALVATLSAPAAAAAQQQPPVSTFRNALALPVLPSPPIAPRLPGDRYHAPIRYAAPAATLQRNPLFSAALSKALNRSGVGLPGTTLQTACDGFGTVGECLSAIYAAHALGSGDAFDRLRLAMTGPERLDLRTAIAATGFGADARAVERSAVRRAKADCTLVAESGY